MELCKFLISANDSLNEIHTVSVSTDSFCEHKSGGVNIYLHAGPILEGKGMRAFF